MVSQALHDIQITDVRFFNEGNIVMKFDEESIRNEAAPKLESIGQVCTNRER